MVLSGVPAGKRTSRWRPLTLTVAASPWRSLYVKPFVKRQKNDAADAEAICEAASRPTMRFVAVKTREQQSRGMLFRTRDLLVRQRTQTISIRQPVAGKAALRGLLAGGARQVMHSSNSTRSKCAPICSVWMTRNRTSRRDRCHAIVVAADDARVVP